MIYYIKGDATRPKKVDNEDRVIAHISNTEGGWGSGFVLSLSSRWLEPERRYREWYKICSKSLKYERIINKESKDNEDNRYDKAPLPLGEIQIVQVKDELGKLFVCNMIAQKGYVTKDNPIAVDYEALDKCFRKLNNWINKYEMVKKLLVYPNYPGSFTIHMPRLGCGLGGGSWEMIEFIIKTTLIYPVFVYDLK